MSVETATTTSAPEQERDAPAAPRTRSGRPEGMLLNVGCGRKLLEGFVNVDLDGSCDQHVDARKPLPFEDGCAAGVYNEHFLEHLTQTEGLRFLRECRRIMKAGGRLRIAMPDLDDMVRRYGSEDWRGDGDMFRMGYEWVQNRCEMLNIGMREWEHRWVYNEEELSRLARLAGFRIVGRVGRGESEWPVFRNVETRCRSKLVMELEKPVRRLGAESPLVSIAIPAYSPRFFGEALRSALEQSYENLEIVVCDDNRDGEIERLVREHDDGDRVRYIRNDKRLGPSGNFAECYRQARGEFIKFLNDDDLLAPNCVSRMVDCFRRAEGLSLVSSCRARIDSEGRRLPDPHAVPAFSREDLILDGRAVANSLTRMQINFLGEPSTAMFRRVDVDFVTPHLASFGGSEVTGAGDVALWLNLLSQGDVGMLSDELCSFRVHAGQRQNDPDVQSAGPASWEKLRFHVERFGLAEGSRGWRLRARPMGDGADWKKVRVIPTAVLIRKARLRWYALKRKLGLSR